MELDGVPDLDDPVLVAAFEGWNDAGEAATGVVEHLDCPGSAVDGQGLTGLDPGRGHR